MYFLYLSVGDYILLYPAYTLMRGIDKQSESFKSVATFENVFYRFPLLAILYYIFHYSTQMLTCQHQF